MYNEKEKQGIEYMFYSNIEELEALHPVENGNWNKEILKEYLIQSCNCRFAAYVDGVMERYEKDETLADLLFDILLSDACDGSDSQMGAAKYIARMDRGLLKNKKELLLQAQKNEVYWKRPFRDETYLEWFV